ncbi:MAG TPA: sialidase family protein, partial [Candidatus Krumholzibacteria bacterium]|nr:sialidase family protein [Candidatus Krumholzibacteria bacterium]
MSSVRVLVGTKKGAFVLSADGKRKNWTIDGPHFGGWEIYHLKGSPVDPNRIYASQSSGWFGQILQRSDDGGKTWSPPGGEKMPTPGEPQAGKSNRFVYEGEVGEHRWYDGTPRPWEFKRVWHLEPSLDDPEAVFAGVEDAALFHSKDGGKSWQERPALRQAKGELWQPGAGGMCLHTILLDPNDENRIYVAISA